MASLTPILNVPNPRSRGAVEILAGDLARLQTERGKHSWLLLRVDSGPRREKGAPEHLVYENFDATTHYTLRGSNDQPTLLPKFLEGLSIRKLIPLSYDERPEKSRLMGCYLQSSAAHFGGLLKEAAQAQGKLSRECRLTFGVPAAARDEAGHIGRTIRALARQTLPKECFEVVVFLNCLTADGKVDDSSRGTIAALESAMRENPALRIKPFFAGLPSTELWTIGRIRKLLFDSVCFRAYARNKKNPSHLLTSLDADLSGLHPGFAEYMLKLFDSRPTLDAARAPVDWDWRSLAQNPLLLFSVRLNMFFDAHRRLSDPTYGVGTPGFTIRAERYADAGGYHHLDRVGEDMDLMARVKNIRVGSSIHTALIRAGAQARGWYSTRRAERALEIDLTPPVNQWFVDGARFQEEDPLVRSAPPKVLRPFEDELQGPAFRERAEKVLRRSLEIYAHEGAAMNISSHDLAAILDRISGLGIELSPDGSEARIGNFEKLQDLLRRFAVSAKSHWTGVLGLEW